jgi:hypothetical protein
MNTVRIVAHGGRRGRVSARAYGITTSVVCTLALTAWPVAADTGSPRPTDALVMAGSGMHGIGDAWADMAVRDYIRPALGGSYTPHPLNTPSEFWPFTGLSDIPLDQSIAGGLSTLQAALIRMLADHVAAGDPDSPTVIFGYSQSSVVATELKRELADRVFHGEVIPPLSFVLLANLTRPNGGLNARFPGMVLPGGWTFTDPAPTDTPFQTVDVVRQYDFFADFPLYPLNAVAMVNAVFGLIVHDYGPVTLNPTDPRYDPATVVQTSPGSDTTYYLIPTRHLPLLEPLRLLGVPAFILDAIEPGLRALVELGYDRSIPFGTPTPARFFPPVDVDRIFHDLATAVEAGIAGLTTPTTPSVARDPALPGAKPALQRDVENDSGDVGPLVDAPAPVTVAQLASAAETAETAETATVPHTERDADETPRPRTRATARAAAGTSGPAVDPERKPTNMTRPGARSSPRPTMRSPHDAPTGNDAQR